MHSFIGQDDLEEFKGQQLFWNRAGRAAISQTSFFLELRRCRQFLEGLVQSPAEAPSQSMADVLGDGTNENAVGGKPVDANAAKSKFKGITVEQVKEAQPEVDNITAFTRVESRVWIKENTFYDECFQDKERSLKLLTERVDRREKRVEDLTNQVFNLVGFFCVFQGVILTAVTQLSSGVTTPLGDQQVGRPLCGKVWFPAFLSALASVVTIVSLLLKFRHLYSLDVSIQEEKSSLAVPNFSHPRYKSFVLVSTRDKSQA